MDRGPGALYGLLYGMRGARDGIGAAAACEHDGNHHRSKSMLAGHGSVSLFARCWTVLALDPERGRQEKGGPVAFA
jgi:hypothetical protein